MKTLIENLLILLGATIIMTFVITSIENADSHVGYGEKTSEEKWKLQQQYLDFIEGRN